MSTTNILDDVANPVLIQTVLARDFARMDDRGYIRMHTEIILSTGKFVTHDDSSFLASLTQHEATEYESLCKTLIAVFQEVRLLPYTKVSAPVLARLVAWRQVVGVFRTLHGGSSVEK